MEKKYLLIASVVFFLWTNPEISAQSGLKITQFSISFFNANTMFPGKGKFGVTTDVLHPGLEGGVGLYLKEKAHSAWLAKFRLGYFNHRLTQKAIHLLSKFNYRHDYFGKKLMMEIGGTAGYLFAVSDIQVFRQNTDGLYTESSPYGRHQAMVGLNISPSYRIFSDQKKVFYLFLEYQFLLQTPFAKSYIPVLPYNMLHLGITIELLKP